MRTVAVIVVVGCVILSVGVCGGCQTDTIHVDALRPAVAVIVPEYEEYVRDDDTLTEGARESRLEMARQLRLLVADIDEGEVTDGD
jgi:hypothetical protein